MTVKLEKAKTATMVAVLAVELGVDLNVSTDELMDAIKEDYRKMQEAERSEVVCDLVLRCIRPIKGVGQ